MIGKTICDICIPNGLPLRVRAKDDKRYCNLEVGLGVLNGPYRKPTTDDEVDYNFECLYRSAREQHSNIFKK